MCAFAYCIYCFLIQKHMKFHLIGRMDKETVWVGLKNKIGVSSILMGKYSLYCEAKFEMVSTCVKYRVKMWLFTPKNLASKKNQIFHFNEWLDSADKHSEVGFWITRLVIFLLTYMFFETIHCIKFSGRSLNHLTSKIF